MSGYFLVTLFFCVLSLIVLLFIFFKMSFSSNFLNKFGSLGVLILVMVLMNVYTVTVKDFGKFGMSLFLLSFYSIFLMGFGYGVGSKLSFMILFKMLADTLLYMLVGSLYFFKMESGMELFTSCFSLQLEILLILIFSVYSLLGLFGFWVYYAMEASYFVSVYMHSCGFICMGLILFLKMILLDISSFILIKNFMLLVSLLSYLFFVSLFLSIKDVKKSFGYFSASSICFMFLMAVYFPNMAIIYFFLSSMIKIIIFELMGFINKSKSLSWWWFFWLSVLYLSNYSVFMVTSAMDSSGLEGVLLKVFIFFIFFLKIYYLFLFLIKVLIIFEEFSMKEVLSIQTGVVDSGVLLTGVFLGFFYLIFYLDIIESFLVVGFLFVKHIFFIFMYMFFLQIIFLNWFLLVTGEEFKSFLGFLVGLVELLKMNLKSFKINFYLKSLSILSLTISKWGFGKTLLNELWVFTVLMVLIWIFY